MQYSMATQSFKLEQLFGSKTRARLLAFFLNHPGGMFFVRELTRKIDAQLNSVRRELKNLIQLGVVVEKIDKTPVRRNTSLAEKKKYYTVNTQFVLYEDMSSLFKKVQILLKNNLVQEITSAGDIDYMAFTGRFVNDPDVPTDIFIVGRIDEKALQKVVSEFEKEASHEINYTLMPKDEFLYRRQVSDRFLVSIFEHDKVVTVNRLEI